MTTVERLYDEVLALSEAEREELLVRLGLARLQLPEKALREWDAEADEAEDEVDAGAATIPWETVRAKMRARIDAAEH